MKRYLLSVALLLHTLFSLSQTGKIEGKITDASTGSRIAAVTIQIPEKNLTIAADVDGRYFINLDASKKYSLKISAVGYTTKIIDDVQPIINQTLTLDIILEQAKKTETAVEVRFSVRKESTNSLIALQKNTSVVAQVISAEAIKRSPDKNTGEILKRVPGTSVQEGKYLVVRGLSDRYN